MSAESGFEPMYLDERSVDGTPTLTPWDIGGPQPVVQQLVAYGALRGEVLDPGTGPGHHAIYFASQGYSVTAIDDSPAAIERAQANARSAGVEVNFQVADAIALTGFDNRFDTVVDAAFYDGLQDDEEAQTRYARALYRATKPGARLFMFEAGLHNVNGMQLDGLPAENFERVLPAAGWHLDYLGTTTYQTNFSVQAFDHMLEMFDPATRSEVAEMIRPLQERLRVIEPLLEHHRVHMPYWAVTATRMN